MSSLYQEKSGRWALQVKVADVRTTLRLGALSKAKATKVQTFIDEMLEHQRYGTQPNKESDVSKWLSSLPREMTSRLERVGLLSCMPATRLAEFLKSFIDERRSQYKVTTITVWEHCVRNLLAFFGEDKPVTDISRDDALAFREFLLTSSSTRNGKPLGKTTVHKRLQHVKMFFATAKKLGILNENPFADVKQREGNVAERREYVSVDTVHTVAPYLPNHWWRLLLTLARFQGLRTPSESLSLQWTDIDLETGKMVVTSPKTEHHSDGGKRTIPIFKETRAALFESHEYRDVNGSDFIFPDAMRQGLKTGLGWRGINLRTTLMKAIKRAGLKPWSRLWHSLRASCETDLLNSRVFSPVTVARYLGHSLAIQSKHYATDTPSDFEAARTADIFLRTPTETPHG